MVESANGKALFLTGQGALQGDQAMPDQFIDIFNIAIDDWYDATDPIGNMEATF